MPFAILKYCPTLQGLTHIGVAEPEKELHVALDSYRYLELSLVPDPCTADIYWCFEAALAKLNE